MNFIPVIKELARAYQGFEGYSSAHIRGLGLMPVQFDVIATLANQPPMTYKQLGEKTLISKSSLTGVVGRMVQKGLIATQENPDDARSHLLKLTAKGQKIFEQVFPEHLKHLEAAFQKLSKKQMKEIEESLKTLKSIFLVKGNTMKNCDLLAEKHRKYNADYIVRGNEALYEVLTDIYKMAVQLDKSDYKHEIHAKLRAILKERDIKTQMNTPELTLIIKYVVGGDRKRATNYSRVLKIALMEGLPPEELSSYISRRGGIGQIFDTEANSIAHEFGKKLTKERLALSKEFLLLSQWVDPVEFKYEKAILQHNDHKMTKSENASFAVFLADYDQTKDVYRVISGHDLGRTYEDCLLRFIIKDAVGDVEKIKEGITIFKKNLLDANRLPKGLAEKISKELQKTQ